ncbi:MAG: hypothetical protein HBSAPP03_29280 [Phycisphaerae bacterium]|nr:MAG: hypothetical protein HBSAPP03_29280 [Phycisphaerae bacterium]
MHVPTTPSILITAGPTHEPIDAVRFLGNRSSGRLGAALAREAARRGWSTTLLLGPVAEPSTDTAVRVVRFQTCSELQGLLREYAKESDILIMAAAVADFRPSVSAPVKAGKLRRTNKPLILELEPTPDLLAEVAASRRPGQTLVGFALEPREALFDSARDKLARKGVDLVVANPLETMDSPTIEAVVVDAAGRTIPTPGVMSKPDFAAWLLDIIAHHHRTA